MSQFLNYITKKQAGGDINSLPGVLSLSKIQKDIRLQKEKKANQKGPSLSQYTPKPGDAERMQANREAYLAEQDKPLNRAAASQFAANLMDNIVEPMFALEAGYGAGQLVKAGVKRVLTKAPTHSEELVRGHINYFDEPEFAAKNPHFNHDAYVNSVGKFGNSTVEEIDPSLIPFDMRTLTKEQYQKFMSNERLKRRKYIDPFTNKKKGGAIVDPRGQWAHPGKDTIIPTNNGRITMKGVPYPVYGQDETGYGQLMMPGGEYSFPGKTIYEKPLDMFNYEMAYGGQMIRRADGSYSQRGLWDNIRANRGSGKKPTKQMLEQEQKIKAAEAEYGIEVPFDYTEMLAAYMAYGGELEEMKKGGYTVTRSNDRKGKTHKVTGPDGTVKYFGDAKLGQHPKDPERKKAFYARHKKNLENNPYFRAFARATWKNGGELMAQGSTFVGYDGRTHKSKTPTWSGNTGYETGGPVEGDELDVTPEELEMLRAQGYEFEMI